jgi:integrase
MKVSELVPTVRLFREVTDSTYKCWLKAAKPIWECDTKEVSPVFVAQYRMRQLKPVGTISKATLVRRLSLLSGIWNTAIKKELIDGRNYWEGSSSDVNYVEENEDRYPHRPWEFYAPFHEDPIFLGLWYHGMRLGEFVGLLPSEIVFNAEIPYFDVKINEHRSIKPGSKRKVPIHPSFFPYLDEVEFEYRKDPGKNWSENFNKVLQLPKGEAAHSIRHRFHTILRSQEIPDPLLDRLTGHKRKSMSDRYGIWTMEHKLKWIKKVGRY